MDNKNNDFNINDFLKSFDATLDAEIKGGSEDLKQKVDRNRKVQSFSMKLDDSDKLKNDDGYIPAYNGEVYFSNHTPLHTQKEEVPQKKVIETAKKESEKKTIPIRVATKKVIEQNIKKAEKRASAIAKKGSSKKIAKKVGPKALLILCSCIFLSLIISLVAISCVNDVLAINRDSEKVVTVTIPADTNTRKVIGILDDSGLIKNSIFCNFIAKIQGFRDDNYLPGIYHVTASMGLEGMLLHFKQAQTTGRTVRLTFPEGYTADQIIEKLSKYEVCDAQSLYTTIAEVDFSSSYPFLKSINNKNERYIYLEGYMYPDTYDFYVGENASSVLRKFFDNYQEKWTAQYQARADALGMSMDEVITLASIIQKEAYGADQMPLISSVIHNRLDYSALYPTLQCDCTTYYVTEFIEKRIINKTQLASLTSIYSTKRCIGLPVGAICNPGNDAINAALNPKETKYYFFLHDDNKKLYLASNDKEQSANAAAALKANSETN